MWETFRTTWSLLSNKQRGYYALLTLAQQFANLLDLIGIGAVSLLVMAVASGRIDFDFAGLYRLQIDEVSGRLVVALVLLAAFSFLMKALGNLLLSLAMVKYLAKVEVAAAVRIASFVFRGSLADIRRFSPADVHYAVNASTSAMYGGMLTSVSSMITGIGLMVLILGTFFVVNPIAAAVVAVYLAVVVVLIQWFMNEKLKEVGRNINKGSVAATSSLWDVLHSFREVSVFSKQDYFVGRYENARELLAKTNAQNTVLKSVPRLIIEQGLLLGVLGFVSWQVLGADVAEGLASVGVFVVGSIRIIGAVVPVQNAFASLKTTTVKAELSQQLHLEMREAEESVLQAQSSAEVDSAEIRSQAKGLSLRMTNVSYTYPGSTTPAVSNISIEAAPGGFVALVGPSGAGKTTVADLILGLNAPDQGTIALDGVDPKSLSSSSPGIISYVPQKPGMVSGTILENVALGVPIDEVDETWARECVRLAALDGVVNSLPDGINENLGRQSDKLSGGQIQRLGLARALYPRPRLIILDEATSALDAGSEAAVSQNIRDLGDAVTLVVIAHRLSTIQHADSVYVIDEGRVVASGPFKRLRKSVPLIEEYVRLMSFDDSED